MKLVSLCLLSVAIVSGCVADVPDPSSSSSSGGTQEDNQRSGSKKDRTGSTPGGGTVTNAPDGSMACIEFDKTFGTVNVTNQCEQLVQFAYCADVEIGAADGSGAIVNDCLQAHVVMLTRGVALGISQGHSSAGDAAEFYGSCFDPLLPTPVDGDLRLGYTCQ